MSGLASTYCTSPFTTILYVLIYIALLPLVFRVPAQLLRCSFEGAISSACWHPQYICNDDEGMTCRL